MLAQVHSPPAAAPAAAPPQLEARATEGFEGGLRPNEVLFVDWSQAASEPITFRELFLRSHALELIITSAPTVPSTKRLCTLTVSIGVPEHAAIICSLSDVLSKATPCACTCLEQGSRNCGHNLASLMGWCGC